MSKLIKHALKKLRFVGGRFEQNKGWLDFDVLPELQAYKRILIETAKEEWKRRNPDRERLPKRFEEDIHLGFHEILEGSCTVPVERIVEVEDDEMEMYVPDDVDEAARIIDATLIAVRDDSPLPKGLSAKIIPLFEEWGKTLGQGESIVLDGKNGDSPIFDAAIRERLTALAERPYEDEVDVTGQVLEADVRQMKFQLWLDDRTSVHVSFTEEQESEVTTALKDHKVVRLRIRGRGEFAPQGILKRIISVNSFLLVRDEEPAFDTSAPTIEDMVKDIFKDVPDEEWDRLPHDLTDRLDHYLYGGDEE